MSTAEYGILLVDRNALNIAALADRIAETDDMQVVGTESDAEAGLELALEHHPDVIVLNVDLPGRGAFFAAESVSGHVPGCRIVFLADFVSDVVLDEALRLKARAYLLTSDSPHLMVHHLRAVCEGEQVFSEEVAGRLQRDADTGEYANGSMQYLTSLTSLQIDVLRHLARGESVKEVAQAMLLSERAVESHKYRIMRKLGIHDRVSLARFAIREGLSCP
jgi:DNA-binding NarL/FixJ family response regulator